MLDMQQSLMKKNKQSDIGVDKIRLYIRVDKMF